MDWLYRLRARIGLAETEATASLVLFLALLGGTVAQHLQATSTPIPADFYAASDAAFAAVAVDTTSGDAGSGMPLALASLPTATDADAAAEPDSTPAQIAEAAVERAAAPRRSGKVPPAPTNLNTASVQELQRLPRIGPALAGRIVEYRETRGPFRTPDQVTDVKGIGEKTLERMRPWIRL